MNSCERWSRRRVRCYVYVEFGDDTICEGVMQVIEFRRGWETRGIGIDCY